MHALASPPSLTKFLTNFTYIINRHAILFMALILHESALCQKYS